MFVQARQWLRGAIKSATLWINSIVGVLIIALPSFQDSLPSISAYLPPNLYKYLSVALVVTNVLLRAKTKSSLMDKGKP